MSLRVRLKTETRGEHERLEARLDLRRPGFDRYELIRLLERFYGFYSPCEQQIDGLPPIVQAWLANRIKRPSLEADLKYFGHTDQTLAALPRCQVPAVRTVGEALGRWYVLEGSTLGGQMIVAYLEATLDLKAGLAFFRSYGPNVARMWKEYCQLLDEYSSAAGHAEAVESAKETFHTLERWLTNESGS